MADFDLVVIGGGITGLGVARLAARSGVRVALLDRGDLVSGASSASSHMLHGGLRYLEHGRFALIREALEERAAVGRMAPHLARPRRFMVPIYRGARIGGFKLRAGLQLYDWLAGGSGLAPHAYVSKREALQLEPVLSPEGLRGAGIYSDTVMDDARIGIAVARDAAAHGAAIHTYMDVRGARPSDGAMEVFARDELEGGERTFRARAIVNATGPWCDQVRCLLSRSLRPGSHDPAPLLRPSRGVHLLYPKLTADHGLLLTARSDGRAFFVVPLETHDLVGTTEVEVSSPPEPEALRPSLEEIRYLRSELRRALPGVEGAAPLALLSGIRPLIRSDEQVGRASREHQIIEEHGVYSVAGGKYTTFRVMARDVLECAWARLGRTGKHLADDLAPLPAPPRGDADLETRVAHAVENEFARRVEDVVRRRTSWWMQPDRGRVAATKVAAVMAQRLGWSSERQREELQGFESSLWEEEALLQKSKEDT